MPQTLCSCKQAELAAHEVKVIQTIRHLMMTARHGGSVTFLLDDKGQWKVRETARRGEGWR